MAFTLRLIATCLVALGFIGAFHSCGIPWNASVLFGIGTTVVVVRAASGPS